MKTVTNLVSAVGEIVDRLTLPGREKKQLETDILQLLIAVEEKTITEQAAAIREEGTRQLATTLVATDRDAGLHPDHSRRDVPEPADSRRHVPGFWDLLEIGLGGYIIGRGSEQLVSTLLKRPQK